MNVLHISTPLSWRGGEQQLAYLIDELNKKNASQWVLCSSNSEMKKYCKKKEINFFSGSKPSSLSLPFARRISSISGKYSIDLIHVHDSRAHSLAVLSGVIFGNKTPIVLSRKVDFPISKNWFSFYKYNYSKIKRIICVSEKVKEILSADIRSRNLLCVVYDGIDFSKFGWLPSRILRQQYNIQEDEIIIGNIAAIAPHKDYFTFVDTAEILIRKNVKAKFLIIGDGPEREMIIKYIQSKNLQHKIILTGFRNDVPKILPELDLFLFTSKTEGLGSSILDAYMCNVPVVATAAGGIPEIVIDEKTGLLSPPQRPSQLADCVMKVLSDSVLKKELTRNAQDFVKNFSMERMAEKTYSVYQEITGRT